MGGDKNDTRNLILAAVLSLAVVVGWQVFLSPPRPPAPDQTTTEQQQTQVDATAPDAGGEGAAPLSLVDKPDSAAVDAPTVQNPVAPSREAALDRLPRIPIQTGAVRGSIALKGGRLDDLHLSDYRQTLDPNSDTVVLLNPVGAQHPYYAVHGWVRTGEGDPGPLPGANTEWQVDGNRTLAPDTPVTLSWDNGHGLIFHKTIGIDRRYMLTVTQSVDNTTAQPVSIAPYGYIARRGEPEGRKFFILHEGAVGWFDGSLSEVKYKDMLDLPESPAERGLSESTAVKQDGWLGFTDHYWMTTLIPQSGQPFTAVYKVLPGDTPEFRTEMRLPAMTVAPGQTSSIETRLFAGAKELNTISNYEKTLNIHGFYDSIDWGWFYFITKPIAWLLNAVKGVVGNMGFSIIILVLIIKTLMFPLAYKSFVAMSKMKKLQPEMEKIKARAGDDRQKLQMEMMALYKKEKANPASGCLPILVQIPIFFSLYKVLFVTIEMRHAPFIWWIKDLSAPDPTSWINLFGLLPYDVSWAPAAISIGVFPILMGITMFIQQRLNPAPADPTQAMIFTWMPLIFMFMLGSFASGLVIYWTANNLLTITQQYIIMRSQGVDVDLLGNIRKSFRPIAAANEAKAKAEAAKKDAANDETPPQPATGKQGGKRKRTGAAGSKSGADAGSETKDERT